MLGKAELQVNETIMEDGPTRQAQAYANGVRHPSRLTPRSGYSSVTPDLPDSPDGHIDTDNLA
jgi:hypothetical protein